MGSNLDRKIIFRSVCSPCVTVFIRLSFTDKTYARGLGEKTMKSYTWDGGKVVEGIILKNDEKLGQVIFLGEEGRGRRYEKISLGRRNPARWSITKWWKLLQSGLPAGQGRETRKGIFRSLEAAQRRRSHFGQG